MNKGYFPGGVCQIVKDGHCLFLRSYGTASTEHDTRGMTYSTLFDIASLTKIVTTTIILRLVTIGKLSLEQTVKQSLSPIAANPILADYFSKVTIQDLLTHRSGLIAWYPFYSGHLNFYDRLRYIVSTTHVSEAGVRYSDLNFMLLGQIIQEATGLTLKQAVHQLIRQPLHMQRMDYGPVDEQDVAATEFGNRTEQRMCLERGLSFDHWRESNKAICGEVNDGNAFYFFQGAAGHAGLFADAEDVSKLGQLYINRGQCNGKHYIDPDLIELSITEQDASRGLGWEFSVIFPEGYGHTGFTGTSLWLVPEKKLTVVTLTNRLHLEEPKNINSFRKELHETILKMI
jgi:CubicO group peptidase (beta-lactamase class C family)